MTTIASRLLRLTAILVAGSAVFMFNGCDGSSNKSTADVGAGGEARLIKAEYGRLVDIYAYRRVNSSRVDRRDRLNRVPVLIERDVIVGAGIESDELFDTVGEERTDANFEFLPFDVKVGHDEMLILWDDQAAGERERFEAALELARSGLVELAAAFRGQNTSTRPIPVLPRNAAIQLTFDRSLSQGNEFYRANPTAVQLLEFKGDPAQIPPTQAFRPLAYRVIAKGNRLIVDTTVIGAEAAGGPTSTGLPSSNDSVTANIRLALPTSGIVGRQLGIGQDPNGSLNGVDSRGEQSVIRDFRSGNLADGRAGALIDLAPPMVVADVAMGIVAIDTANRVVTLNKRFSQVAVRGRIPFVDGGIDPLSGLPAGPNQAPTEIPLRNGDVLFQEVLTSTGQRVRLRAEILQNLDVGNVIGDTTYPALGLAQNGTDGGSATVLRVRVASLTALDASGLPVSFETSTLPLGADCTVRVHYYEHVPYLNSSSLVVSDNGRRSEFLTFDPAPPFLDGNRQPIPRGTLLSPMVGVGLRFSEPMDLERVQPLDNYLLTNSTFNETNASVLLRLAKATGLSVVAARLLDQDRDGTLLRLSAPVGLYHVLQASEQYYFHMMLGTEGVTDLAGNSVELFDRRLEGVQTFSVGFTLDPQAADNLVGWRVSRFAEVDEDGTPPGSIDFFGQFQLRDGRLFGAPTTRFSRVADGQTLPGIRRDDRGECTFIVPPAPPPAPPPPPPNAAKCPLNPPGQLYLTPNMTATNLMPPQVFTPPPGPRVFGGIVEPHNPRGSRLQMTYREDDYELGYHDASTMLIDIEQMFWAPWNNEPLQFDLFDRYTLSLGHCDWRPDISFQVVEPPMGDPCCEMDCASLNSGLRPVFSDNVLQGSAMVDVVKDKAFAVNPNDAFRASTGTTMVPYPRFERTYTWRDSRLVTWDRAANRPIGLGGAKEPEGVFPGRDRTAKISSPWVPDVIPVVDGEPVALTWVRDGGDFGEDGGYSPASRITGQRSRDHDPIALPLLMDFKVFPDDPRNGIASGVNLFHIAYVGPIWPGNPILGNGYYNAAGVGICGNLDWPTFRTHTSGGVDGLGQEVQVDIARVTQAIGGWIKDVGMGDPIQGRYQTKAGDDHLHWSQADFVRKVSMVTMGFFDTRQPNRHALTAQNYGAIPWEGLTLTQGFPDFQALGTTRSTTFGISDLLTLTDPPSSLQPAGTSVRVEYRLAETFARPDVYGPIVPAAPETFANRNNLLNPNYACEAYRYASANGTSPATRVAAEGLTPYVIEENLGNLKGEVTGTLPRYMNMRIIFENNTAVTPALSPSLRSLAIAYRMKPQ